MLLRSRSWAAYLSASQASVAQRVPKKQGGNSEEARARRPAEGETTGRRQDKRPQCAARSVDCFCYCFSPIQQCALLTRNVRAIVNPLLILPFPHIAEAGNG